MLILPRPKVIQLLDDYLEIQEKINIIVNLNKEDIGISLNKFKKDFPKFIESKSGTPIQLIEDESLKEEEYKLNIDNDKIKIVFKTNSGCFNAFCTLKQILLQSKHGAGYKVRTLKIVDYPDFKNRGLMLDISRNRVYKVKTILEIIDILSDLKLNQLQFSVEGNAFYFPSKDKYYSSKDDYLNYEDILIIDKYCKENNIKLFPNQNSFGHMCYWINQEEFKHLAECPDGFTYRWMVNSP